MKSGICPKCEKAKVHIYKNTAVETSINIGFFKSADLNYYICTNCGYVELFVENDEHLPRIAEKHPKVKIK